MLPTHAVIEYRHNQETASYDAYLESSHNTQPLAAAALAVANESNQGVKPKRQRRFTVVTWEYWLCLEAIAQKAHAAREEWDYNNATSSGRHEGYPADSFTD